MAGFEINGGLFWLVCTFAQTGTGPGPRFRIGLEGPAMLLVTLMGMIGLVVLIATTILVIHFDLGDRLRRQPEK